MVGDDGVEVYTSAEIKSIEDGRVIALVSGEERTIEADTVLVALGRYGDDEAIANWQDAAPQVIAVGDCAEPMNNPQCDPLWRSCST